MVNEAEKPISIKEYLAVNASEKRGSFGEFAVTQEKLYILPVPSRVSVEENKKSLSLPSPTIADLKASLKVKDDKYSAIQNKLNFTLQPGVRLAIVEKRTIVLNLYFYQILPQELRIYKQLLETESILTCDRSIFVSDVAFQNWKKDQLQSISNLATSLKSDNGPSFTHFLEFGIDGSSGLKEKSKIGERHTFVQIQYEKNTYISPILRDSLDPSWNLSINIPVSNPNSVIVVSVWLYVDHQKDDGENNPFLGSVLVSMDSLLKEIENGETRQSVTLGKRSSRSHVSGQISFRAQKIDITTKDAHPFNIIPKDARSKYDQLVRTLLKADLETLQNGSETTSKSFLALLRTLWQIPDDIHYGM